MQKGNVRAAHNLLQVDLEKQTKTNLKSCHVIRKPRSAERLYLVILLCTQDNILDDVIVFAHISVLRK